MGTGIKIAFPTFGNGKGNENFIPNFWEWEREWKFYSRHDNPFPVMGTGMENYIPEFQEWKREWKISFPTFGNGNGNGKLIPKLWEREWEACIPGNAREREFSLTPGEWD